MKEEEEEEEGMMMMMLLLMIGMGLSELACQLSIYGFYCIQEAFICLEQHPRSKGIRVELSRWNGFRGVALNDSWFLSIRLTVYAWRAVSTGKGPQNRSSTQRHPIDSASAG